MERRIREEDVTKAILKWLLDNGWDIITFDFPQSGTGKVLHPSNNTSKTEGAIIPDIVAFKKGIVVDFENKDRFVFSDFEKINFLKNTNIYDRSLSLLLKGHEYKKIYYGIGIPYSKHNISKAEEKKELVDFIVYVDKVGDKITITDNIGGIFDGR